MRLSTGVDLHYAVHKTVPEAFMTEVVRVSAAVPARVWRGTMIGMLTTDPPVGLGDHRIPTLNLWGDHDDAFLRPQQNALMAMLPSARFRAYAGVGHAPHWGGSAAVARDLLDFMTWEDTGTR